MHVRGRVRACAFVHTCFCADDVIIVADFTKVCKKTNQRLSLGEQLDFIETLCVCVIKREEEGEKPAYHYYDFMEDEGKVMCLGVFVSPCACVCDSLSLSSMM